MGTEAGMIRAGRALLGLHEQPMGSNYVPKVTKWYNAKFHIGTVKFSWCDASITEESYASDNQDAVCGGGGFAYVPSHAQWFRSKGRFHTGTRGIRAGDVVFYNWSRRRGTTSCDHVGLVERVFSDGSFYALEGNHDDAFQRVHRDATYVSGYGRPDYASEDDMQPKDMLGAEVELNSWIPKAWPKDAGLKDGKLHFYITAGSTYGHARATHDGVDELKRMITAQNVVLDKLADALKSTAPVDVEALKQSIRDELAKISVKLDVSDGAAGT